MTFELKSGKNKAKKKVTDGSRKLLFHGDEAPNEIKSKYCAIWNPAVGTLGAWDTEGMIFVSNYSVDSIKHTVLSNLLSLLSVLFSTVISKYFY